MVLKSWGILWCWTYVTYVVSMSKHLVGFIGGVMNGTWLVNQVQPENVQKLTLRIPWEIHPVAYHCGFWKPRLWGFPNFKSHPCKKGHPSHVCWFVLPSANYRYVNHKSILVKLLTSTNLPIVWGGLYYIPCCFPCTSPVILHQSPFNNHHMCICIFIYLYIFFIIYLFVYIYTQTYCITSSPCHPHYKWLCL